MKARPHLIALIPEDPVQTSLEALRQEFMANYNEGKPRRIVMHITLIPPFLASEQEVVQVSRQLHDLRMAQPHVSVELKDFGNFKGSRVIFVKIKDNKELRQLYQSVYQFLKPVICLKEDRFHPHITISSKHISKELFAEAAKEYTNRTFQARFECRSLCILGHNGKNWEVLETLPFATKSGH